MKSYRISLQSGPGLVILFLLVLALLPVRAEEILFIGNSFTYGGVQKGVADHGGVPKLVEAIAASKGKKADTTMLTTGGKDWGFHLRNPATDAALKKKPWNWIVLQDYSTKATHVGSVDEFMHNGETFYTRIALASPDAHIVLYETWALGAKNKIFAPVSSPLKYASPAEMYDEVHKNYNALQIALQAKDPRRQVLVAPVGTAFEHCVLEHPEINLYTSDYKHADQEGSYLAALVLYATLFNDSPVGATSTFPGFTLDAAVAGKLQGVAEEVTRKK